MLLGFTTYQAPAPGFPRRREAGAPSGSYTGPGGALHLLHQPSQGQLGRSVVGDEGCWHSGCPAVGISSHGRCCDCTRWTPRSTGLKIRKFRQLGRSAPWQSSNSMTLLIPRAAHASHHRGKHSSLLGQVAL